MKDLSNLKVAIVHDWLVGGGAERVVYELHQMFPDAPIYTSYCTPEWRERLDNKVVTGFLQNWPFSLLRKYVGILRIWWFTHLDFSQYDLVISSSGNGEAKGIKVPDNVVHICYCHSPTHYYWRHYDQYMKRPGFGIFDPLARLGLKLLVGPLRRWDLRASRRPDYFIANSSHIQADIKRYYNRDAVVIHPPIDIERFNKLSPSKRHGFITVGRQTSYKRTDVIVDACTTLGLPLKVIGNGPEHYDLVRRAGPTVEFLTNVTDEEMPKHMAEAQAFLFAAFEDFGVTPVEALAAGTPVIAYKAGGALDYVIPNVTGSFYTKQDSETLSKELIKFKPSHYSHIEIMNDALEFSSHEFRHHMQGYIEHALQNR